MSGTLTRHPVAQALEHSLGMFVVTDRDGVALYANDGAARRTGYAVAETVGKKPGKLWGGHMPRAFYDHLWETIDAGQPIVADLENQRKDGRLYAERVHIAPILGTGREPQFFIAAQPFHLESAEALDRFGVEFRWFFSTGTKISDLRFIEWINRWFTAERDPEGNHSSGSTAGFIESELVDPLRERFAAREEDRVLIEAAQADAREFRELYAKYQDLVRQYFLRHLRYDRDVADDLTQDTFYRALSYLPGFTATNASYGTYLLRVAHNLLVNHYRKKKTLGLFDERIASEVSGVAAPEPLSVCQIFDSPLLRPAERRILSMKYQEGFAVQEIAALLGTSENAVKLRLSRARKRLRGLL
ncbi:MAG: sigma-70 family RNA polymerase sigma factor [Candidatus Moranbacteria bacterium]|nr:sigma-70 family RNA polymerase sigma factor [Candidatus Moranbacteria bacterium]MBP6033859.1 sigma-70 family RNA polymerase sigma factor [Candidatus Moranbacteria bacterium]MBP7695683.1 sigma-70 family RNA polymerase sigma factor [Candidatus Moranbacteria bacterium]